MVGRDAVRVCGSWVGAGLRGAEVVPLACRLPAGHPGPCEDRGGAPEDVERLLAEQFRRAVSGLVGRTAGDPAVLAGIQEALATVRCLGLARAACQVDGCRAPVAVALVVRRVAHDELELVTLCRDHAPPRSESTGGGRSGGGDGSTGSGG